MKYCTNCGNELKGGKFCSECGQAIDSTAAVTDNNSMIEDAYRATGGNLIETIKLYRSQTGLSLAQAKEEVQMCLAKMPEARPEMPVAFTKKGREKLEAKARIEENKKQGIACCPKCGSTSLSGNKKGFGIGKAVVGAAMTGGIGLVAGNLGAKKVRVTCMNCGNSWKL